MSIGHLQDLYDGAFDYELRTTKPKQSFVVATTPRSGSTLLGLKIWQTGLLGGPTEYLNLPYRHALAKRLGATGFSDYYQRLLAHRTSPNGVFSTKLFWSHYVALQHAQPQFIAEYQPDAYVFLTRENKTAQAISLSRSMQTQAWVASATQAQSPRYLYRHILKCREYLRWQEQGWTQYFNDRQARVLRVTYEALQQDADGVIQDIQRFIAADTTPQAKPQLPDIERQGTRENQQWQNRFQQDFEQFGYGDLDLQALEQDFPTYVGDWSGDFPNELKLK